MGGGSLLVKFHSLSELLVRVYPEVKWEQNSFQISDIWTNEQQASYFVEHLQKQSEHEISYVNKIIQDMGNKDAMLIKLLHNAFPKYNWTSGKKSQYVLKACLGNIFPNAVALEEYRHPDVSNLELDYFYPLYNLAFEYQVESEKCFFLMI